MIKIGLTGGIGSGKSTVAKIFETLGVPVFYADNEAKKAYIEDDIINEIKKKLGVEVFTDDKIDFKKLAEKIFSNKENLIFIENLIHPYVIKNFKLWLKDFEAENLIIMESALLFETGYNKLFDKIICVTAPEKICIERIIKRDNVSEESVYKKMSNQLSQEEKIKQSDFVIVNDGQQLLIPQIMSIYDKIINKI